MNPAFLTLMIFIFVAFMFWTTYSQQRKAKRAAAELQRLLKKGDEVLTIGGLFGTVRKIGDDYVTLEFESGATARLLRKAIREIVSEEIDDLYGDDEDEIVDGEYDEVDDDEDAEDAEDAEDGEYEDVDDVDENVDDGQDEDVDDEAPQAPDAPDAPTAPSARDN